MKACGVSPPATDLGPPFPCPRCTINPIPEEKWQTLTKVVLCLDGTDHQRSPGSQRRSEGAELMGSGSLRLAGESAQMRPSTAKASVPCGDPGRQGATRTLLSGPTAVHTWLGYAPCCLSLHSPRSLGVCVCILHLDISK